MTFGYITPTFVYGKIQFQIKATDPYPPIKQRTDLGTQINQKFKTFESTAQFKVWSSSVKTFSFESE